MNSDDPAPFSLNSGSGSSFGSRADDIFGVLGNIEAKHEAFQKARANTKEGRTDERLLKNDPCREDHQTLHKTKQNPTSRDQDKQEFKKPRGIAPRRRVEIHDPARWMHYNLANVSRDDMSERSNTAAALSFLNTRKTASDTESPNKRLKTSPDEDTMEVDTNDQEQTEIQSSSTKHVFKKVTHQQTAISYPSKEKQTIQVAGRTGCMVMPEYVVGQKPSHKQTSKINPKKDIPSGSKICVLSHLDDDEDDDQEHDLSLQSSCIPVRPIESKRTSDRQDPDMDLDSTTPGFSFHSKTGKKSSRMMRKTDRGGEDSSDSDGDGDEHSTSVSDVSSSGSGTASPKKKDLDLDAVD